MRTGGEGGGTVEKMCTKSRSAFGTPVKQED